MPCHSAMACTMGYGIECPVLFLDNRHSNRDCILLVKNRG